MTLFNKAGTHSIEIAHTYGEKTQDKITAEKPFFIGRVAGFSFYEHPIMGDETTMLVKFDGVWYLSDQWEIVDADELEC